MIFHKNSKMFTEQKFQNRVVEHKRATFSSDSSHDVVRRRVFDTVTSDG